MLLEIFQGCWVIPAGVNFRSVLLLSSMYIKYICIISNEFLCEQCTTEIKCMAAVTVYVAWLFIWPGKHTRHLLRAVQWTGWVAGIDVYTALLKDQGSTDFPKIWEPSHKSSCQNGNSVHFPYREPTNVRCHSTKLCLPGDLALGICASLLRDGVLGDESIPTEPEKYSECLAAGLKVTWWHRYCKLLLS
jgi:hypothetical protein